jgi:hypothetical protein
MLLSGSDYVNYHYLWPFSPLTILPFTPDCGYAEFLRIFFADVGYACPVRVTPASRGIC